MGGRGGMDAVSAPSWIGMGSVCERHAGTHAKRGLMGGRDRDEAPMPRDLGLSLAGA